MTRALACVPSSRQACTAWTHCGIQTAKPCSKPCSKPATESGSPIIPPHAHSHIDTPSPFLHWANKTEEMTQGKAFAFSSLLCFSPFQLPIWFIIQPQTHAGKTKARMNNQAETPTFGRIHLNCLLKYSESTPKIPHACWAPFKVKGSSTLWHEKTRTDVTSWYNKLPMFDSKVTTMVTPCTRHS